jgi:phosphoribosylglycinamide formyltransferase-1
MTLPRIVALISGRGSNLAALIAAEQTGGLGGTIATVISNRPDAGGLALAQRAGIATAIVDHRAFADRAAFDAALAAAVDASHPDLVVLAGFMRILGRGFVERYTGRMLNIHPSLLPAYPGLHTHRRALADGVRIHGCTVHFVSPDLDHGPIVIQGAVAVHDGDDEDALAARVLEVEHRIYPAAVAAFCAGRLVIANGRVRVTEAPESDGTLVAPAFVTRSAATRPA